MNTIIKRMLAFSLSLFLIIAPTIQQANAASAWAITSAISAGARVIVSATKSGYKSAINISPSVGKVAGTVLKRGNQAYLLYAIAGLIGDRVDYVLDPANNRVIYKTTVPYYTHSWVDNKQFKTAEAACRAVAIAGSRVYIGMNSNGKCVVRRPDSTYEEELTIQQGNATETLYLTAAEISAKVLSNAASGHSASQALVNENAVEMVVSGDFDRDLLAGAVPTSDNKPLIPSIPGNQNGNVTPGTDPGYDSGMSGASPGSQSDAAKAASDAAKAAADAAAQSAKDQAEAAAKAADAAKDLVNSGADQAAVDAANAAAAAAQAAAQAAKDVAQAAKDAAAAQAAASDKAAAAAAAAAARDAAAAKAAADAALAAAQSASAADKAAAQAAADAAVRAAEKAKAEAEARAKAAEEAAKAAEKAKAEAAKPFELPPFCSWAKPVCDAVDWLMKPVPDFDDDTVLDIDGSDVMPVDTDINFGGSCPANFEFNGSIFGNPINIVLLDTSKFCGFLSTFVKFPVYAASSLFALYILGGRKDG